MTKSELIANIAGHFSHLTNIDTTLSVQNILDNMTIAMVNDDRIEIRGFGSFSVIVRPPRTARNPKTGKKVDVAAKHVPHFKPGLELKKRVM
jgi:integration host factor subunit beta